MSKNLSEKIHESAVCCCVDVGSIIDNSDTSTTLSAVCQSDVEAQELLATWQQQAEKAASDPVSVTHRIEPSAEGLLLTADITFSCQAELLIFQLAQR